MKVEALLHRHLDRPPIEIIGAAVIERLDDHEPIECSTLTEDGVAAETITEDLARPFELMLRAGCELLALAHHCRQIADEIGGVFASNRALIQLRFKQFLMACHTLTPPPPDVAASSPALRFQDADFESRLLDHSADEYDYVDTIDEAGFAANLRTIPASLPARGAYDRDRSVMHGDHSERFARLVPFRRSIFNQESQYLETASRSIGTHRHHSIYTTI